MCTDVTYMHSMQASCMHDRTEGRVMYQVHTLHKLYIKVVWDVYQLQCLKLGHNSKYNSWIDDCDSARAHGRPLNGGGWSSSHALCLYVQYCGSFQSLEHCSILKTLFF